VNIPVTLINFFKSVPNCVQGLREIIASRGQNFPESVTSLGLIRAHYTTKPEDLN
jgi:hypothetical protein